MKEKIPNAGEFKFHYDIEVQFRDLDALGHVNNAMFFTYFEYARAAYTKELVGPKTDPREAFPFIMLDAYCRFIATATLRQKLALHVRTTRIGTKSFDLEYLIIDSASGENIAFGSSTLVSYDYKSNQTIAVPVDFRKQIERIEGRAFA